MPNKNTVNKTAIVVNDDTTQLTILSGLLHKERIDVLTFDSAEAALTAMDSGRPPDLIVTDLYMPGIDGWRFCRLLRSPEYEPFNRIPVLIVSATFSGDEASRITADLGANAFMSSPVDGKQFIEQVWALLSGEQPRDRLRVLIVEDSKRLVCLLKKAFESQGYLANTALTAQEAVDAFGKASYDVAVIDYHLPDSTGDTLLAGFQRDQPDCVCVMMTTDPGPELALAWMRQGAAAYLRKPFDPQYLIELCAKARREKSLLRVEDMLEDRTLELRESEKRQRQIIENTEAGYFFIDRDGLFRHVNDAWLQMHRYDSVDEVVGKHFALTQVEEDLEKAQKIVETLLSGGPIASGEFSRRCKDGSIAYHTFTANPVVHAGQAIGLEGFIIDITKRKQAEEEREKLEAQLRQAQKMEAVGQLAGGIAHDFNNLLQVILGYGEAALDEAEEDSPLRTYVDEILKTGNRAKTLVSQLLAFSRRQVLEMKDLNLNDVIANMMKILRRVIGEHIALEAISGHDLGIVNADRGQIEQILMNMCVNARDAMPTGGRIIIETENVKIDQTFCESHSWAKAGRYVLLSMTDTGCGMDEETLGHVFEPFFTTKDVGEGSGLGLAMIYGLVKQHQGMITVYSEVGKGTTFKIYLPLVERAASTVGTKIKGPVPGGTETILVAEDDETVLKISQAFLERAGYTVLTATDGEKALHVFEDHADEIDLVLLDVMMPNLGGRAVFERIREKRPQTRVLFSSGYSMNAIHTNFVIDEGLQLMQKPYQRTDLLRKVREVLDK